MAWFVHVVEGADGRWSCVHARKHLDSHEELTDAIHHLQALTAALGSRVELLVHRHHGEVEAFGAISGAPEPEG